MILAKPTDDTIIKFMMDENDSANSSQEDEVKIGHKQQTIRKRGRPRIAKTSLIILGEQLGWPGLELTFFRQDEYEEHLDDMLSEVVDVNANRNAQSGFVYLWKVDDKVVEFAAEEGCDQSYFRHLLHLRDIEAGAFTGGRWRTAYLNIGRFSIDHFKDVNQLPGFQHRT